MKSCSSSCYPQSPLKRDLLSKVSVSVVAGIALSICLVGPAAAQDAADTASNSTGSNSTGAADSKGTAAATEEAADPIKTGVIANSGSFPTNGAIDVETSGAAPGDEQSTITASINSTDRTTCVATLNNASEKNSYSVRARIIGRNESGAKVLTKSFTAMLKPKGSASRSVSCRPEYRMQVELVSADKR
ncbi:MAG: hypothetical protein KDD69_05555 [Bdellovibrionales bacterium]|nr:hypothetical protein [Bdellovibrionales bacterium]